MPQIVDAERQRIEQSRNGTKNWRRWGPYVSERQWGTVREDYSPFGTAWDYLTHDEARSRAYRWGEDGIAGFCDDQQFLCLSIALWNGRDPILKERLFGLTNQEGNHGEDVKELYYYLDAVPSYAYARMLYKLSQAAYPYEWLLEENARRRGTAAMEFELIDTGVFDGDKYFDIEIEYAKADADDVLMRVTVHNRGREGTKACGLYVRTIGASGSATIRLRLRAGEARADGFFGFDGIVAQRLKEAHAFYADLQKGIADEDIRRIQRQAFAGMLWNKQFYDFNVREWLNGDPLQPLPPEGRKHGRNCDWAHLIADDIIAMPDKWEYPWFAAWDLAFHCVTLSLIDPDFAKAQLLLLCEVRLMHPNGQLPAYEWAFGDVNPPVHAWAAMRVFENDRNRTGGNGDYEFLQRIFHKLLLNFTWWVNRKDPQGLNIFEGGFLGLDNIGVFDRSQPLPTGGHINQSDGTAWMATFCLNMLRVAVELSRRDPVYEHMAIKFFDHFWHIAGAMTDIGQTGIGLWNDEDNFFYDVLAMPCGSKIPLRLRSMVGLISLFTVGVVEQKVIEELPELWRKYEAYRALRPDLVRLVSRWDQQGVSGCRLVALTRVFRMTMLLRRMLDESEFLSPFGVRALSR